LEQNISILAKVTQVSNVAQGPLVFQFLSLRLVIFGKVEILLVYHLLFEWYDNNHYIFPILTNYLQ
jgi:hypothetical protein